MGRVTDVAPAGLVPAAWFVVLAAHVTQLPTQVLVVALVVMDVLLAAFVVVSRGEMTGPVLNTWQSVLVDGLAVTIVGTVGLAVVPELGLLPAVTLYGWMLLPGVAYLQTGGAFPGRPSLVYFGASAASLFGAALYAAGHIGRIAPGVTTAAALVVVGLGQTAGVVTAVRQNTD
jgi:hypothetical protein